ncbi:MAG: transposase [Bdellovibrionales bacterium]
MKMKESRKPFQFSFSDRSFSRVGDCFGGSLLKNSHAKRARPLNSKLPLHIVLRARRGGMRLPRTFAEISDIIVSTARKYGVRIYEQANVGNHVHLLVRIGKVWLWAAFIRELTGRIARAMIVAGVAARGERFWKCRPFTRIVQGWGKAFKIAKEYVYLNQLEANGFISRKETRTLNDLHSLFGDSA